MEVVMDEIKWKKVLDWVKEQYEVSEISCDVWLKPISFEKAIGDVLYVSFPHKGGLDYVRTKYTNGLKAGVKVVCGMDCDIAFEEKGEII